MRRLVLVLVALVAIVVGTAAGFAVAWVRNPRLGATRMNRVVNPFLVSRGLSGAGRSEIGTLEHVGRRSGIRRLTPVHPVPTADGFRIMVPLGLRSEWAANVLAAGHCRLQWHAIVHELDEPTLLPADALAGISGFGRAASRLGVMELRLRRFAEHPGTLEPVVEATAPAGDATPAARDATASTSSMDASVADQAAMVGTA